MTYRLPSYVLTAASTCFVYDYLLNLSAEVEFIWKSGWRWTTLAYQATQLTSVAGLAASMFLMGRDDVSKNSYATHRSTVQP
ncbi:hypothetical protein AURDEDRAFT_162298 [Auricularia subglabra TFB-10046 SS5]|nr:hypothetical protein AURDEDRAFT_162298 [Auricularia subglabra TFB-10046 SS5]